MYELLGPKRDKQHNKNILLESSWNNRPENLQTKQAFFKISVHIMTVFQRHTVNIKDYY